MSRNLIIHAHPRPTESTVTAGLLARLSAQPDTAVRSLYNLYPDFDIDVQAEQQALLAAGIVVFVSPVYWYSVPGLLKHWFDTVLLHGWAYGHGGTSLRGKTAWWVTSAGAPARDYSAGGQHGRPLHEFTPVVEHVATYCGMHWHPPFVVHAGHHASSAELETHHTALLAQWHELSVRTGAHA
jgi:glutathione-regulated potassium-efflux system ancillary protein KefF